MPQNINDFVGRLDDWCMCFFVVSPNNCFVFVVSPDNCLFFVVSPNIFLKKTYCIRKDFCAPLFPCLST